MTAKKKRWQGLRLLGVNSDLPANLLKDDVYSDVINMEVYDVGMRASRGNAPAFDTPLFPPEHLVYNKGAGSFFWVYASSDGIGVSDGLSHFDITPAAGVTSSWPTKWTESLINNLVVLNNGIDVPVWWDNIVTNPMQPLPAWPTGWQAKAMRSFNYNLIAMDITQLEGDFISKLAWSTSSGDGIPTDWQALPENDAGDNVLADTIGALVDGLQVRGDFLLFKEHSTYIMSFIGGNFVFGFRKVFNSSGLLAAGCAAEYLGNAYVLTDGDFIRTDTQNAESLIDKRMRAWLFNNIDTDNYATSFVTSYHTENQVWCCFPENGSDMPNLALVWDGTDNKFGVRELYPKTPHIAKGQVGSVTAIINWDDDPAAWDTDLKSWNNANFNPTEDALLQADRDGLVFYAVNEGNTYGGKVIATRLERLGLDFGDVEALKLVRAIIPRLAAADGTELIIRVGSSRDDANQVTWSAPVTYIHGESGQAVYTFAQGRFIAFSIESTKEQQPFILYGVEFDIDYQGRF